jgi:F-type H+-transporting ATPase subunit alpha
MKQPQNSPLSVAEQVAIIYSGINGLLDNVPVNQISEFSNKLIAYLSKLKPEYGKSIETSKKFDAEAENIVKKAVETIIKEL